jgi:hypothetical protein
MTTLSNSDKVLIVDQKIKNLDYQKYGTQLDIALENASSTPDQENLNTLNAKMTDIDAKLSLLNEEKNTLQE